MVCDRCIRTVEKVFVNSGIIPSKVTLGAVKIENPISSKRLLIIETALIEEGFELVGTPTPILVVKIKAALISLYEQNEIPEEFKLSSFLSKKFSYDYSHLSRVFSNHEKDTIEHFLIKLRIEKAKELLSYKDNSVSEIAYKLGYSSVAHFSRQFKEKVGVAPSVYQSRPIGRKKIEDL